MIDALIKIKDFLLFVNENWTLLLVVFGLGVGTYKKVKDYLSKSTEDKINIAKTQIQQIILKMIAEAEVDYTTWNEAGSIKRSQVISQIYAQYPILTKVTNQSSLTEWIDAQIDAALITLRTTLENNKS